MTTIRRQPRRRAGFTLMEVLLVLLILGVIAAMVVPRLLGSLKTANIQQTQASIKGLENALEYYAKDHGGEYPSTAEGLQALQFAPADDTSWTSGPYIDSQPLDAWKNPFQYAYPAQHNTNGKPDIWSFGADKQDGTADDVTNWLQM